jgi:predicted acetyltransferase
MMHAQLHDIHERGEPIAALWASEETIYGRFGYGLAAWAGEMTIAREWSHFAQPFERRGRARFVQAEEAVELFPRVWDELMKQRPGVFSRSEAWWKLRRTRIPDEEKTNPKRFVVLEVDGEVQAYAVFKSHMAFEGGVGASKLEVFEAIGANPQATAEIWRFLFDIDWQATITVELIPLDHPLFFLLATPRRAAYRMIDSLWVRIVDLEQALARRTFAGSASVVLDVRDAVCHWNEGRWRVSAEGAARTEDAGEISLDVSALGSAYLGAVPFSQLREAQRIDELVPGAVERADGLFASRPLPWCPEIF